MKSLLSFFLLLSQCALAQQIPAIIGSSIKPNDAQKILDHHNKVRMEVGVQKLTWNPKLASYAQSWAQYLADSKRCKLIHSKGIDKEGNIVGENLFWGSDANSFTVMDASVSWYEEKNMYHYERIGDSKQNGVGHYTQMVWKNTKELGVGIAICKDGGIVIVANYYPAGNYIGEYPY